MREAPTKQAVREHHKKIHASIDRDATKSGRKECGGTRGLAPSQNHTDDSCFGNGEEAKVTLQQPKCPGRIRIDQIR